MSIRGYEGLATGFVIEQIVLSAVTLPVFVLFVLQWAVVSRPGSANIGHLKRIFIRCGLLASFLLLVLCVDPHGLLGILSVVNLYQFLSNTLTTLEFAAAVYTVVVQMTTLQKLVVHMRRARDQVGGGANDATIMPATPAIPAPSSPDHNGGGAGDGQTVQNMLFASVTSTGGAASPTTSSPLQSHSQRPSMAMTSTGGGNNNNGEHYYSSGGGAVSAPPPKSVYQQQQQQPAATVVSVTDSPGRRAPAPPHSSSSGLSPSLNASCLYRAVRILIALTVVVANGAALLVLLADAHWYQALFLLWLALGLALCLVAVTFFSAQLRQIVAETRAMQQSGAKVLDAAARRLAQFQFLGTSLCALASAAEVWIAVKDLQEPARSECGSAECATPRDSYSVLANSPFLILQWLALLLMLWYSWTPLKQLCRTPLRERHNNYHNNGVRRAAALDDSSSGSSRWCACCGAANSAKDADGDDDEDEAPSGRDEWCCRRRNGCCPRRVVDAVDDDALLNNSHSTNG